MVNALAGVGSALLIPFFYLGLVPSMATEALDYTRSIPVAEAVAYVARVRPWQLFTDPYTSIAAWFIPLAVVVAVFFVLARRAAAKFTLTAVAISLPLLGVAAHPHLYPLLLAAAVRETPRALSGQCDGEEWSEGVIALAALGDWMILWLFVVLLLLVHNLRNRRHPPAFPVVLNAPPGAP